MSHATFVVVVGALVLVSAAPHSIGASPPDENTEEKYQPDEITETDDQPEAQALTSAETIKALKMQAFERSQECPFGQVRDSYILTYNDPEVARMSLRTQQSLHAGNTITIYETVPTMAAIDVSADRTSFYELMDDISVKSISADCIVKLDPTGVLYDDNSTDAESKFQSGEFSGGDQVHSGQTDPGSGESDAQPGPVWGLDRIDGSKDGYYTHGEAYGENSIIYVLDTGIRITHDDFGSRAVGGFSSGCKTKENCKDSKAEGGWMYQGVIDGDSTCHHFHGTHCASTAAGNIFGVAKKAKIVSVQVLSCHGGGSLAGLIDGVDWAVENANADENKDKRAILSMSLGFGAKVAVFDNFVNEVSKNNPNLLIIAAAGNDNKDSCQSSPASASMVMSIGASDIHDKKASFSNWGPCIDVQAPGVSVKAAISNSDEATHSYSGTSMACPHVSGVAALLWTTRPDLNGPDVRKIINCLAMKDQINEVPSDTTGNLLLGGKVMGDAETAQCIVSPSPPPMAPSPPAAPPAPPADPPLPKAVDCSKISKNMRCGARYGGTICRRCCSRFNWCGGGQAWCGAGNQPEYSLFGDESICPDASPPASSPPIASPPASSPPDASPPASSPPDASPPASSPPATGKKCDPNKCKVKRKVTWEKLCKRERCKGCSECEEKDDEECPTNCKADEKDPSKVICDKQSKPNKKLKNEGEEKDDKTSKQNKKAKRKAKLLAGEPVALQPSDVDLEAESLGTSFDELEGEDDEEDM